MVEQFLRVAAPDRLDPKLRKAITALCPSTSAPYTTTNLMTDSPNSPHPVVIVPGTLATGPIPASAARPTSNAFASDGRVRETSPIAPAASAVTSATPASSTGLSAVPRVWTAHSLTGVGVASMTVEPMARALESPPRV